MALIRLLEMKEPANPAEKIDIRTFGIYDYSKKNKLANNTEWKIVRDYGNNNI